MNGREYFAEWARRLKLDGLPPDAIQDLPPPNLARGPVTSRRGGRITLDLVRLSPEEIAKRRTLSEEFLKQPVERVPAEEERAPADEDQDEQDDDDPIGRAGSRLSKTVEREKQTTPPGRLARWLARMADGQPNPNRPGVNVWGHLDPANQERLGQILREQIPELFRLNRIIEQRTGYSSEIGRSMLVDVLSHLGTLAEREDLSSQQEASQLSKIEEHIRRAVIEHPEEVVRNRIVDVRDLWAQYHREVFPYRQENALHGVPRHQELEELRTRIDQRLESARSQKPNETTWEETLDAAADMTEAANLAGELADKLEQCLGAAQRLRAERERDAEGRRETKRRTRQWRIGTAIAIALAVGGWLVAYQIGKSQGPAQKETGSLRGPAAVHVLPMSNEKPRFPGLPQRAREDSNL